MHGDVCTAAAIPRGDENFMMPNKSYFGRGKGRVGMKWTVWALILAAAVSVKYHYNTFGRCPWRGGGM